MPTRQRVQPLVDLVEQGRFVEAIEAFYADDAAIQENTQPLCTGRPALAAKERNFLSQIQSIRARPTDVFIVDGDRAVIHWVFDVVDGRGRAFRLDELAYQLWRGDKIVREQYYHDSAQMRNPLAEK